MLWADLFQHFVVLSMISFGGVTTTVPEMHRYIVDYQHWLTEVEFTNYFVLARVSPGPNVIFVGLLGWGIGLSAGGIPSAILGAVISLVGILLPSTIAVGLASHWVTINKNLVSVQAFRHGMSPIVISLMLSTGWILASDAHHTGNSWPYWSLVMATILIMMRTRIHLLWLLAGGGCLGWMGWI